EPPVSGGLAKAAKAAAKIRGKKIPVELTTHVQALQAFLDNLGDQSDRELTPTESRELSWLVIQFLRSPNETSRNVSAERTALKQLQGLLPDTEKMLIDAFLSLPKEMQTRDNFVFLAE